jgi:uncharacterized membrane protein
MTKYLIPLFLLLAACGGGDDDRPNSTPRPKPIPSDTLWHVGAPRRLPIVGTTINIPQAGGTVNYVTRTGSLRGKTQMHLKVRIDADPGTTIVPTSTNAGPAIITLYFQRCGDNWSAAGKYETYRWYATGFSIMPLEPKELTISAPLNVGWTAVLTSSIENNPTAFEAAKNDACFVGFVLGGGTGYGHGIHAVGGNATLTILDWIVE